MDNQSLDVQAKVQARLLDEAEQCGKELGHILWQIYRIHPDDILTQLKQDPELLARIRAQKPVDDDGFPISQVERSLRATVYWLHTGEQLGDDGLDTRCGVTIDFLRDPPSLIRHHIAYRNHSRDAAEGGWLPIADAPRDGTEVEVLVFDGHDPVQRTHSVQARFVEEIISNEITSVGWKPTNGTLIFRDVTHYKPIQPKQGEDDAQPRC